MGNKYLEKIAAVANPRAPLGHGYDWDLKKKEVVFSDKAAQDELIHKAKLREALWTVPMNLVNGAGLGGLGLAAFEKKTGRSFPGGKLGAGLAIGGSAAALAAGFGKLRYDNSVASKNSLLSAAEKKYRDKINSIEGWGNDDL